jgi:AcrR family transcriptional regulator
MKTKQLMTMVATQDCALDLFERRGFDAVSVAQVAASAGVAPVTIYRHFGSKERLVTWDAYDPPVLAGLRQHLRSSPPLDAMRRAIVDALDAIYAEDRRRILRRAKLMADASSVAAVVAADRRRFAYAVEKIYAARVEDRLSASVLAGVAVAVVVAAVDYWVAKKGSLSLAAIVTRAFAVR